MLNEIKQDLKKRAAAIRKDRLEFKEAQRQGLPADPCEIVEQSKDFRYRHVAYCMIRGRKYEEIEPRVHERNEIDQDLLKLYIEAYEQHVKILKGTLSKSAPDPDKLYVVVDDTLPKTYAGIQASHALAEYMKQNPGSGWTNGTLVVLKADMRKVQKFKKWGWVGFHEPDLGGRLTAVADFKPKYLPRGLPLL